MSGPEILLILAAVFAAGRIVARWRGPLAGRAPRSRTDLHRRSATAFFLIGGLYGVIGLGIAFVWGFESVARPHGVGPNPAAMAVAIISGMWLLFAALFLWPGFRVVRRGGLPPRLARAAGAAYREFFATTESVAKSKSAPDRDFFEA